MKNPWIEIQKQIDTYVETRVEQEREFQEQFRKALDFFKKEIGEQWEEWKERIHEQSNSFLVADFDESPLTTYTVETNQKPAMVASTDGSQIFANRHELAPVALVHTSRILIDYVNYKTPPIMESFPTLLTREDFNHQITDERELSFQELVSDQRCLDELKRLADMVKEFTQDRECYALTDGSLILWQLASREWKEYEHKIAESYVKQMDRFREKNIPLTGYISNSGSREVTNVLRLSQHQSFISPYLTDAMLFSNILKPGERSTIFHSRSKILEHYGENRICFFYMNLGEETAKIEFPVWMNNTPNLIDRTAAQCFQQSRLGGGYPIILSEAHERAVIRGADREMFYQLLERSMIRKGLRPRRSLKQMSKRVPRI